MDNSIIVQQHDVDPNSSTWVYLEITPGFEIRCGAENVAKRNIPIVIDKLRELITTLSNLVDQDRPANTNNVIKIARKAKC